MASTDGYLTFNEELDAVSDLYTVEVSDAFKATVKNWFGERYICDNTNFPAFFNRVLANDYGRYQELLKLEAGYNEQTWQWLVDLETTTTGTSSGSALSSGTSKNSVVGTNSQVTNATGYGSRDMTDADITGGEDKISGNTTQKTDGTVSSTNGKNSTTTYGKTDTQSGSIQHGKGTTQTTSETGSTDYGKKQTTSGNGSSTSNQTTTHTGTDSTATIDKGITQNADDQKAFTKVMPQSISYASTVAKDTNTFSETIGTEAVTATVAGGTPAEANWEAPSSQAETYNKSAEKRSNAGTNETTYNTTDMVNGTGSNSNEQTVTDSGTDSNTKSGSVIYSGDDTDTYNDLKNASTGDDKYEETGTGNQTTDNTVTGTNTQTTTYGKTDNRTVNETTSSKNDQTVNGNNTQTADGSTENTSTNSGSNTQNATGRHVAPQELLKTAVRYIIATSAWNWMQGELEPCFLGTYDFD